MHLYSSYFVLAPEPSVRRKSTWLFLLSLLNTLQILNIKVKRASIVPESSSSFPKWLYIVVDPKNKKKEGKLSETVTLQAFHNRVVWDNRGVYNHIQWGLGQHILSTWRIKLFKIFAFRCKVNSTFDFPYL